jgi:hypothetical protein
MTRSMRAILRRLSKLEKRVAIRNDAFCDVTSLALEHVSDEQLDLLIGLARGREAGLCALSENESAALASYEAAREAMSAAPQAS